MRVPLLDHGLLEWEMGLPVGMRFRHRRGKYLLKKVAARYLPPVILKPRKQGFTIPIGHWLRGNLGRWAEALFTSTSFIQRGIFERKQILNGWMNEKGVDCLLVPVARESEAMRSRQRLSEHNTQDG